MPPTTLEDYAQIARSVYEPTKAAAVAFANANGWTYTDFRAGRFTSGFQGALYHKAGSNPQEMVVAFKGSKSPFSLTGISDWLVNDVLIGLREVPTQYAAAQALLDQARTIAGPGCKITLVGHSLGGALVQCVSSFMLYVHNIHVPFVNFNGPGMRPNVPRNQNRPDVKGFNYIVSTDMIGTHPDPTGRSHFGRFYAAPSGQSKAKAHGMKGVFGSFNENNGNLVRAGATLGQLLS